jgi:hypothetical protein
MLLLLNHADRSALCGQRLGARERAYVPSDYPAFGKRQVEEG